MPHIRIRALSDKVVEKLSSELPKELASLLKTPTDNFTVEKVETQFYKDGVKVEGDPMVEVLWFDRGQDQKSKTAKLITTLVERTTKAPYISVIFTSLDKQSYFENGEHF